MKVCSVEDCENTDPIRKGYCSKHYMRFRRGGHPLHISRSEPLKGSAIDIFNKRIIKNKVGCWDWSGRTNNKGYGLFKIVLQGVCKVYLVHRLSYEIHVGQIPTNMQINHICDNRLCSRPDHLFVGTQKDNMQDMIKKGRQWKYVPRETIKGEIHGGSKLKNHQVIEIKNMIKDGIGNRIIAKKFNVSHPTISLIRSGLIWKHIKLEGECDGKKI